MVICTYYLSNNCRFGSKCNNDHIDLSSVIKSEVDVTLKGNQWPLSCFGPFKERNCVPNFIEDVSFEEIRMMYLEAKMQNNIAGHQMQLMQMINEAKQKMQWLSTTNRDIMNALIEIYNQPEDSAKAMPTQANPFATAPMGGGNVASAASIFGGGTAGGGGFGTTGAGFGGAAGGTAGNIFGAAPNQSAANIFGSAGTGSTIGGSIFAKPAPTATGTSSIFGGSATLGQQQPASSSVFGGPAVFGGSGSSLFSSVGQPQTAAAGGSIFGSTTGATAATSGNLFAQPFGGQQQSQSQNLFAQAQPQAQSAGSPFTAAPAPAAASNPFGSPFSASAAPQQNLFQQQATTAPPPFGQAVQPSSQQSLFLPAPQPATTTQSPFGSAPTAGAFGAAATQQAPAMVAPSQSATVYSRVEDLTKEQLDAFAADRFELGKIPTAPPPREMCM
ncbi:nuclear pore complex protein Nup98-Nup96-like [Aedes albopictus]|uniref:Nucleoporin NUP42 n=1 Tax=Aedes albopictus TaxID=7160 RepID=A0ABM1YNX1_AEDAL